MKQCANPHCENPWLPATPEYFSRNKNHKDGLQTLCKVCMKAYKKQHYQTNKEEISKKHKVYRETHKAQMAERAKRYVETHREHYLEYHRQYYQTNKEQMLEQMKQHYQVHGPRIRRRVNQYRLAHREEISQRNKVRWRANKERIAAKRRQHYQVHKDQMHLRGKQYYATHKEHHYEYYKQYRKTERGRLIRRANWHKREAQKKALGGSYTAQDVQAQYQRQKGVCYWCHKKLAEYHIDHIVPLSRGGSNTIDNIVVACPTCNMRKAAKLPHEWSDGGRLL